MSVRAAPCTARVDAVGVCVERAAVAHRGFPLSASSGAAPRTARTTGTADATPPTHHRTVRSPTSSWHPLPHPHLARIAGTAIRAAPRACAHPVFLDPTALCHGVRRAATTAASAAAVAAAAATRRTKAPRANTYGRRGRWCSGPCRTAQSLSRSCRSARRRPAAQLRHRRPRTRSHPSRRLRPMAMCRHAHRPNALLFRVHHPHRPQAHMLPIRRSHRNPSRALHRHRAGRPPLERPPLWRAGCQHRDRPRPLCSVSQMPIKTDRLTAQCSPRAGSTKQTPMHGPMSTPRIPSTVRWHAEPRLEEGCAETAHASAPQDGPGSPAICPSQPQRAAPCSLE